MLVNVGTLNATPALDTTPTVTTTGPLVAPAGTVVARLVALQAAVAAVTPLNFTVLVPLVAPKLTPVIVTAVPDNPVVGDNVVIVGVGSTVNARPLLFTPPTLTTTLPVVAPAGTGTAILVALQLAGLATVPLNRTVELPCVLPKLVPVRVTTAPTPPDVGDTDVRLGGGTTVNVIALLV